MYETEKPTQQKHWFTHFTDEETGTQRGRITLLKFTQLSGMLDFSRLPLTKVGGARCLGIFARSSLPYIDIFVHSAAIFFFFFFFFNNWNSDRFSLKDKWLTILV